MKAKPSLFIVVVLLSLTGGVLGCGKDSPTPQPSKTAPQSSQTTPQSAQKSSKAVPSTQSAPLEQATRTTPDSGWPPAATDDSEIILADNLLARNYYVVMDSSGSMGEVRCSGNMTKSAAAKIALAQFARSVPGDANLGLAVFDGKGIAERIPLGLENRERFISAVNATIPGNGTPLHDATLLGYRQLEDSARRQAGYGEYHLVIVTDGQADPPTQDPTPVVRQILQRSPIVIHTIGFCIGTNHALNQPGRTIYQAADNPQELRRSLDEVLAEAPNFDVAAFQ
jgi:Ca-activated chloride channel family protein